MKSYDYKFRSLGESANSRFFLFLFRKDFNKKIFSTAAAEPKQVIRALRATSTRCPRVETLRKPKFSDRSLVEKSSSWKLPPNIYRLKDHSREVGKKQMGKLGPYQCFTVERDDRTVKNHNAVKPLNEICEVFYDLPSMKEMMLNPNNRYKSRFLRSERFKLKSSQSAPPPTKYFPQNFLINSNKSSKSKDTTKKPIFFYPQTTVPMKDMSFQNDNFFKPSPGRYNPHDVSCKCYLIDGFKKCPGNVRGDGNRHVFNSTVIRLIRQVPYHKQRLIKEEVQDDNVVGYVRPPRDLISFRAKRSHSVSDLTVNKERDIRYNTMVKKRNLFSVKTGRPVGFLTAMPRFKENPEVSIKMEGKRAEMMMDEREKPQRKSMTKKRLREIAAPKNPLPTIVSRTRVNVFEPLPPASQKLVGKVSINESPSAMSELELIKGMEAEEEEEEADTRNSQVFVTKVNLRSGKSC